MAEAAKLKLNLVLVCRSWKQMATEVLYEVVRVSQRVDRRESTRAQKALRWTLDKTAGVRGDRKKLARMYEGVDGMSSNTARGYGRWMKQLAIYMDFVAMEDVAAIVRHCSNLRTLIVAKKNTWTPSKIESIFLNDSGGTSACRAIPQRERYLPSHTTRICGHPLPVLVNQSRFPELPRD
jgi:hypothetical protein